MFIHFFIENHSVATASTDQISLDSVFTSSRLNFILRFHPGLVGKLYYIVMLNVQ